MKKIPTLFVRDRTTHLVTTEVTPGCEWVVNGEGIATRKWDGTCCMIRDGVLYKRREIKWPKTPPEGFEQCGDADPVTGKVVGWVPVGNGPEDQYHREAFTHGMDKDDGTYELCGPAINGDPDKIGVGIDMPRHMLIRHGGLQFVNFPRDFCGIRRRLELGDMEGVVWHHPDGRMAKIKGKDFGFKRK